MPWYRLEAGDTVYIHYRNEPYREKLLISGRGTPSKWIRVLGVPAENGELPVISGDGATTSRNMHYRWQDATGDSAIQWLGVIQIAVRADENSAPLPGYIEIANLRVQDGYGLYRFTAENGAAAPYSNFAACIYARSAQHLVIRDSVLTNCGQGFYNWTGDGSSDAFWTGLARDIVLRGNHFYNNGHSGSYSEHQCYTEADGVTVEYNQFGPQRPGSRGSQIKDRSAGTIVRYNHIEHAIEGWDLDLVEPQEGWLSLLPKATFKQTFVYGNLMINRGYRHSNFVHWNEDHYGGKGRAATAGSKLFFYNNTVISMTSRSDLQFATIFNATFGGYDCPPGKLPGVIDVRNNIFAVLPFKAGSPASQIRFGYCGLENFDFGVNWVSPGWIVHGGTVSGESNLLSPANNDPGFVGTGRSDLHLTARSSARRAGGSLAREVTSNPHNLDLTPTLQYVPHQRVEERRVIGPGSDLGAFSN